MIAWKMFSPSIHEQVPCVQIQERDFQEESHSSFLGESVKSIQLLYTWTLCKKIQMSHLIKE